MLSLPPVVMLESRVKHFVLQTTHATVPLAMRDVLSKTSAVTDVINQSQLDWSCSVPLTEGFDLIRRVAAVNSFLAEISAISRLPVTLLDEVADRSRELAKGEFLQNKASDVSLSSDALEQFIAQRLFGGFFVTDQYIKLAAVSPYEAEDLSQLGNQLERISDKRAYLAHHLATFSPLTSAVVAQICARDGGWASEERVDRSRWLPSGSLQVFDELTHAWFAVEKLYQTLLSLVPYRLRDDASHALGALKDELLRPLVESSAFAAASVLAQTDSGITPRMTVYAPMLPKEGSTPRAYATHLKRLNSILPAAERILKFHALADTWMQDSFGSNGLERTPLLLGANDPFTFARWYEKSVRNLDQQLSAPETRRIEKLSRGVVVRVCGGTDLWLQTGDAHTHAEISLVFGRDPYSPAFSVQWGEEGSRFAGSRITAEYAAVRSDSIATANLAGFEAFSQAAPLLRDAARSRTNLPHDLALSLETKAKKMQCFSTHESDLAGQVPYFLSAMREVGVVLGTRHPVSNSVGRLERLADLCGPGEVRAMFERGVGALVDSVVG